MPIHPPKEGSIYRTPDGTRLLVLTVIQDDESDFFSVEVVDPEGEHDMSWPSVDLSCDEWAEIPKTLECIAQ